MRRRDTRAAPSPDPFGERGRRAFCLRLQLLGGRFDFETDSPQLLRLVRSAYAELPPHSFSNRVPPFRIRLVLTPPPRTSRAFSSRDRGPPPVRTLAAGGILCGAVDGAALVTLSAREHTALILVPQELLRYRYHVRYELIEFAVYLLAARAQKLVSLHAACVGLGDRGVLVVGASGSGKSTLMLHCLLSGLELLAEDSVLIRVSGMRATGVANFLHLRPDSLRFLARAARLALLQGATMIQRRSGVRKLEVDLRRTAYGRAAAPQRLKAVVFLSARRAREGGRLLIPVSRSEALRRLAASQRYAAQQPGWGTFKSRVGVMSAYELRRGSHPQEAAKALRELLDP